MKARPFIRFQGQGGAAAVEFALVALFILFPLLFATVELGRVVFYWNAAAEVTRLGARLAVVCDLNDSDIKRRMSAMFPVIDATNIDIVYEPTGCSVNSCARVRVSVKPLAMPTYIPVFRSGVKKLSFSFPRFSTTLPRESMLSNFSGAGGTSVANPVCQ